MRSHQSTLSLVAMGLIMAASAHEAMAQQQGVTAPAGPPQVLRSMQPDNSHYLRTSQVLGIPTSHCGHVIDLMMKNRMREKMGINGTEQLHMPHLTVGMKPGDLEFLCVHLICDGDAHKGPVFQIGMKNNSCVPIGNFKVSLVGVLGQIHVHAPTASICIPRMEAGEEKQIQLQLPMTCMCMGPLNQQSAFDTLIVALDSHDELMECDELNNVQILKRCDIALLVTESPVVVQPAPAEAAPALPLPVPEAPVQKNGSPLDNLDLDELQLDNATSLQFRL